MNRVGLVVDMSHSAQRSTLEAIEISERPIAITHANPAFWHSAKRNKSREVLKALGDSGGMFGFSMYPHHLRDGSDCSLESFCQMIADTAELMGIDHIGLGSDLCQGQPDSVVEWMRSGRWTKTVDFGEGLESNRAFQCSRIGLLITEILVRSSRGLRSTVSNRLKLSKSWARTGYAFLMTALVCKR